MPDLADLVQSALDAHAADQAVDLARSEQWSQVRQRYSELSVNLIVNGHESLAHRVDREYQAMREAMRLAVDSQNGKSVADDYALWEAVTEFQFTVGHLERRHRQLDAMSHVEPAEQQAKPAAKEDPPKRSWTQDDLDDAIREYKAKRASTYRQFVSVFDDPNSSAASKRAARKQAKALFGRNVIARALGVKAAKMVSQSQPWIAIAHELGLERKTGKQAGTGRRSKVGHEIAVEQASMDALDTDDHAKSDALLQREEREKTLRQIRKLAESELDKAAENAKALYDDYNAGELTDEQVRQQVAILMVPGDKFD